MKPKTSLIWSYFVVVDDEKARCNLCDKVYSRKGRTTTALKSHLKAMHAEDFAEFTKLTMETKTEEKVYSTPAENVKKRLTPQPSPQINDNWDSSHYNSQEIDRMIAEMIALQNLPFSFVEGTGFRRLMNAALPKYKLRGRDYFSSLVSDNLYNRLAKKVKALLAEFDKLSFTTDVWSDLHSGIALLSLTAHGISEDFCKKDIILKCEVMDVRHTGVEISTKFQALLEEWGIDDQKVHCIVRDCGATMVSAVQLAGFEDVTCAINQIQHCIRAGVESQEWLIQLTTKLRQIATYFSQSLVAQADLTKIQKERLNQDALSVIQDCPTRWNSTFYMMERFSKLKDSIDLYLSENPIDVISPEDWVNVSKFVELMRPFEEITKNFSSSQVNISSVIPLIHVLMSTLQQEEMKSDTSEELQNFTRRLRDELNSSARFGELIDDDKYTIATYLDPRYKSFFFPSITTEQVEAKILNMAISRKRQSRESTNSTYEDSENCVPPKRCRALVEDEAQPMMNSPFQMLECILSTNEDQEISTTSDESDNLLSEILSHFQEYKKEKRLPLSEDPLVWWKFNSHKYRYLLPLVRQYLSVPPSSVASEQLFSGAGLIYEQHRNGLLGATAAKLIFMKYNLPLINYEY